MLLSDQCTFVLSSKLYFYTKNVSLEILLRFDKRDHITHPDRVMVKKPVSNARIIGTYNLRRKICRKGTSIGLKDLIDGVKGLKDHLAGLLLERVLMRR